MELLIVNFSDIPGGISNLGVHYKHMYANEIYYRLKQYVSDIEIIPKETIIVVGAISSFFEYQKKVIWLYISNIYIQK